MFHWSWRWSNFYSRSWNRLTINASLFILIFRDVVPRKGCSSWRSLEILIFEKFQGLWIKLPVAVCLSWSKHFFIFYRSWRYCNLFKRGWSSWTINASLHIHICMGEVPRKGCIFCRSLDSLILVKFQRIWIMFPVADCLGWGKHFHIIIRSRRWLNFYNRSWITSTINASLYTLLIRKEVPRKCCTFSISTDTLFFKTFLCQWIKFPIAVGLVLGKLFFMFL